MYLSRLQRLLKWNPTQTLDQIRAITNSPRIGSVFVFCSWQLIPPLREREGKKPLTECHTPAHLVCQLTSHTQIHPVIPSDGRLVKTGMPSVACQESEGRC